VDYFRFTSRTSPEFASRKGRSGSNPPISPPLPVPPLPSLSTLPSLGGPSFHERDRELNQRKDKEREMRPGMPPRRYPAASGSHDPAMATSAMPSTHKRKSAGDDPFSAGYLPVASPSPQSLPPLQSLPAHGAVPELVEDGESVLHHRRKREKLDSSSGDNPAIRTPSVGGRKGSLATPPLPRSSTSPTPRPIERRRESTPPHRYFVPAPEEWYIPGASKRDPEPGGGLEGGSEAGNGRAWGDGQSRGPRERKEGGPRHRSW